MRYLFFLVLVVASCSPVSKQVLNRKFNTLEKQLHDHSGFTIYDLDKKKEIYSFQGDKYFTPASNTKIFTLYACLTILGDSIPALHYLEKGDSLIFRGTGDPSFLYRNVYDSRKAFEFLNQSKKNLFYLIENNFFTSPLGPGWAWDDYKDAFSAERSSFPMYGNSMTVKHTDESLKVNPQFFTYQITVADSIDKSDVVREIDSNKITFYPGKIIQQNESWEIPFRTGSTVTAELLRDTLKRNVVLARDVFPSGAKILYSNSADSVYKVMMQESDNFIAEQLLLVCAGVLSDSLKPEIAIEYMKKNYLRDLPDSPVWIDGSGLSRYNLFTPRSIVKLWEKIYNKIPRERIFSLLAVGGKTGTIKNVYKNDPSYIYGKTGTLSNNHCLSGFLVTKNGRTLIFSFMNNNYPGSVIEVRQEMESILKDIFNRY